MQYMVLLKRRPLGTYVATAPAAPGCKAEGRARDETLIRFKTVLEDWLAGTEVAMIDVAAPEPGNGQEKNPWLMTAGIFADDPSLEPMLHDIYAARAAEQPLWNV